MIANRIILLQQMKGIRGGKIITKKIADEALCNAQMLKSV